MPVRVTVLASGSKGNATVVSTSRTRVLVDAGLSCRETLRRMSAANEEPRLDAILISHEHSDHIAGLDVLARKLKVPVYITEPTYEAWQRDPASRGRLAHTDTGKSNGKPKLERREEFRSGRSFHIGDIAVEPFTVPHDAVDPVGFAFRAEGVKVAIVTDLGYMPPNVRQHIKGCDVLMIESNHDLEMLRGGSYPWSVKQRVMSRVGHLSNDSLAEFFAGDYDGDAAFVILAHISEENNHPELARAAAEKALSPRSSLLHANRLMLAPQRVPMEPVVV